MLTENEALQIIQDNLQQEVQEHPRWPDMWNRLGQKFAYHDDHVEAIKCFDKAIEINPRDASGFQHRSVAYRKKGLYDQAISDLNKVFELTPRGARDAMTYNHRGIAYYHKGLYDQAIADYNKAQELNPGDADTYWNRAVAYYSKGEYDRAWEDIKRAQDLGETIPAEFLDKLRRASGREK